MRPTDNSRASFDLDQFQYRMIRDAINEATSHYWIRRAEQFESIIPTAGDYRGHATNNDIDEQALRIQAKAQACRNRATLCELTDTEKQLILDMLGAHFEPVHSDSHEHKRRAA